MAGDVVVGQHPGGPARDRVQRFVGALDAAAPPIGVPGRQDLGEVEAQVQLVVVAVVGRHLPGRQHRGLPHRHPVARVAVEQPPDVTQQAVGVGRVQVGVAVEDLVGIVQVGEVGALEQRLHHVHAEPVHPAVEPEPQGVVHGRHHLGVAPVQVGLLGQEEVQVVLARGGIELPGRGTAEVADPVVGRAAVRTRIAPDVPVPFGVVPRRARRPEPLVLGGGVVGHPVDQHPHAGVVALGHQCVDVGQGAEEGIDVAVVADVVAVVLHG